jgi:predicted ATP-dependent serine protease
MGRVAEARAHYDQVRRMLVGELGRRSVSVALEHARRSLASVAEPARAPVEMPVTAGPAARAAFVGRTSELASLRELAEAARRGAVDRAVVVLGEPGIGKSCLLDALARIIAQQGGLVLRGRGFEAEQ